MKLRLLMVMFVALVSAAAAQENINAYGIFYLGGKLIVFGSTHVCADNSADGRAQIYFSSDGGKTLNKVGPEFMGSEYERFLIANGKLWVGGIHTAEGPTVDPFVLVPVGNGWEPREIYSGDAQLHDIAITEDGELRARIQPITLSGERNGAEITLYSSDSGRTWKRSRGKLPKNANSNFVSFSEIERTFNDWQIKDLDTGGFEIQHVVNGDWQTVSEFRTKPCTE